MSAEVELLAARCFEPEGVALMAREGAPGLTDSMQELLGVGERALALIIAHIAASGVPGSRAVKVRAATANTRTPLERRTWWRVVDLAVFAYLVREAVAEERPELRARVEEGLAALDRAHTLRRIREVEL